MEFNLNAMFGVQGDGEGKMGVKTFIPQPPSCLRGENYASWFLTSGGIRHVPGGCALPELEGLPNIFIYESVHWFCSLRKRPSSRSFFDDFSLTDFTETISDQTGPPCAGDGGRRGANRDSTKRQ